MNFSELNLTYDLHDSLITHIRSEVDTIITLDFCHWKQCYYTTNIPETGQVELICHDAELKSALYGTIDYFSILHIEVEGDHAIFHILDDFHDTYHTIEITSSFIEFVM